MRLLVDFSTIVYLEGKSRTNSRRRKYEISTIPTITHNPNVIHNPNENTLHETQTNEENARPEEQSGRAFYRFLFERVHVFPCFRQKERTGIQIHIVSKLRFLFGGASATNCELDEHPTSSFSKVFSISSSGIFSMLSGRLPAFRIIVKYPS